MRVSLPGASIEPGRPRGGRRPDPTSARRNSGPATRLGGERGAAAVEFSLVAVVFFMLIFGILDFSRMIASQAGIVSAAREGSRYGSATGLNGSGTPFYADCDGIRQAALRVAPISWLAPADVVVEYDHGPGTSVFRTCPVGGPGPSPADIRDGDRIILTVNRTFSASLPLVLEFIDGANMSAVHKRTINKEQ